MSFISLVLILREKLKCLEVFGVVLVTLDSSLCHTTSENMLRWS